VNAFAFGRPFVAVADSEYVCDVWFERDRKHVSLKTPRGRVIFDLWDGDVDEAIDDGFLDVPGGVLFSSRAVNNPASWQPAAVASARAKGLI
jgi:hypothetical protein